MPQNVCNVRGAFFSALFREEGPLWRAHDTRRCAKRTCCRSGKGSFAACSGRNSTGIFFLFIFIHQFKLLFLLVSRLVDPTRPDLHFFPFWKRTRGCLLPYFCSENARGRYFGIVLWNASEGVYSVLYGMPCRAMGAVVTIGCEG